MKKQLKMTVVDAGDGREWGQIRSVAQRRGARHIWGNIKRFREAEGSLESDTDFRSVKSAARQQCPGSGGSSPVTCHRDPPPRWSLPAEFVFRKNQAQQLAGALVLRGGRNQEYLTFSYIFHIFPSQKFPMPLSWVWLRSDCRAIGSCHRDFLGAWNWLWFPPFHGVRGGIEIILWFFF